MIRLPDLAAIAPQLRQMPDGTWHGKSTSSVSYPEWGNEACAQVEESSFWFRHRNDCILEAMKRFPPSGPVFDVGGGNGFVAKAIQDAGFGVVLLEPGRIGARNAQQRGIRHVICAGLQDAGFLPSSLGAIGLFDVVEHIADDLSFLGMTCGFLSPGGRVYITVPSYEALWSHADVDAGHMRRYNRKMLGRVLADAGFTVEFLTGFFRFLPPAILTIRTIPYRLGLSRSGNHNATRWMRAQHEVRSRWLRCSLNLLQKREVSKIRACRTASFGASWLVVAKKR